MFSLKAKAASSNQHRGKGGRAQKSLTRKERRKQERVAKKQRKAVQYVKNKEPVPPLPPPAIKTDKKPLKKPTIKPLHQEHESGLAKLQRKRSLETSNKRDDVEISRLEKLLKIKRRKKLPTSFKDEGLDYILDLTDKSGQFDWGTVSSDSEHDHADFDSEPEEFSHEKCNQKPPSQNSSQEIADTLSKRVRFSVPMATDEEENGLKMVQSDCDKGAWLDSDGYVESSDEECELAWDSDEDNADSCEGSDGSDSCEGSDGSDSCEGSDGSDSCEGSDDNGVKYIPPHQRAKIMGGDKEKENNARLQRQVQGLINRLSESNMKGIATQLEQMYQEHSRNDMNSVLGDVLLKLCATAARLTDRFAMEHAMLVAILHSHVGQEVGAFLVQKLAQRFAALLEDSPLDDMPSSKECSCVVMILAFLYCYRVIHCSLVYDIIRRLLETLSERNIELLLLILKHTGMEIRRDDASSLKDIILLIQQKASSGEGPLTQSSRSKFMLETISALKTNNARKIPNYDPSLLEHMKRLLRGSLRSNGPLDEGQLKISLNDLLNADTRGKWWIVGSAWSGRDPTPQGVPSPQASTETWVLELARKQRMTTDIRKTVFSVVMTSEDYTDAFEKLVKLGLKEVQEREMVHVLVHCCLQESTYNPYYAFLGQKLCEFKRSHQVTFQYSVWDRFKELESLSKANRANLIKLLTHLISTRALSIAVLKVVEFVELGPIGVKFFKSLLTHLLCDHPEDTTVAMFARVTPLPHLKTFRDKLLVFMKHYLVAGDKSTELVKERFQIVEKSMRTGSHLF